MKNRYFLIALFFCYPFVSVTHCQPHFGQWFVLCDKVVTSSDYSLDLYYYKQIGEFDSKGVQDKFKGVQLFNFLACMTDSESKRFRMSFYPGIFLGVGPEAPFVAFGLTDMWFSFHYKLSNVYPFVIRTGIKLKLHGPDGKAKSILRQNDIDFGLLFGKRTKRFYVETSLSYRYRFRGVKQYIFGFNFDKPGNEIHYKLDAGKICFSDFVFSGFVAGYYGFDKSLGGERIDNSASSKLSVGARLHIGTCKESVASISFMIDVLGKNEYSGWTFTFSI